MIGLEGCVIRFKRFMEGGDLDFASWCCPCHTKQSIYMLQSLLPKRSILQMKKGPAVQSEAIEAIAQPRMHAASILDVRWLQQWAEECVSQNVISKVHFEAPMTIRSATGRSVLVACGSMA